METAYVILALYRLLQPVTDPSNPAFWAYVVLQTGAVGALVYTVRAFTKQELVSGTALADMRAAHEKEKSDIRATHSQVLTDLRESARREAEALRQQIADRDTIVQRLLTERNATLEKRDQDLNKLGDMVDSLDKAVSVFQNLAHMQKGG